MNCFDEACRKSLDCITSGFAFPFAAFDVEYFLGSGERFELHHRIDNATDELSIGSLDGNATIYMVAASA